ncbi:hypothetical protein HN419_02365 [Candidatus Woesearchaeota archaeon]|jgi:aspartokinase|nr:hypothetical protein [Candidatus Woesearchaeota archaeon]MBT3537159.1 hypothetical protein [Candidatus Woesearchaeota archaeon]MBT4697714.1 hypothetical protein [Candidatus Woesearchaeota archaeon]MBT4716683.1 hypothetical protein [Candidatus Woesearchaeota archaeon]MBT7106531.1 hypothetical protein [Candidatus Woesearchaeota archaeon]
MRSIGIKAGSSVFRDEACYSEVAGMLALLTESYERIFFVVSALEGETDRTIDSIAADFAKRLKADSDVLRAELDNALRGNPTPYDGEFNTTDVASRLVTPEGNSVRNIASELESLGVSVATMEHGPNYPLVGLNNGQYLYATPDLIASHSVAYDSQVVVVPGFGVRNSDGEVMCTGRGSSDLTLVQIAQVYGLPEIVYWKGKDAGGFWRTPGTAADGILETMTRDEARARSDEKVLDSRVYDFRGDIRITLPGRCDGGTLILK